MMSITDYQIQFRNLRPDRSSGHAKPHKACILLAVIDLIERGFLRRNRVLFDTALKEAFSERFERYRRGNDKDDPSMPYFYLTTSSFWHLQPKHGKEIDLDERLKARKHGGPSVIDKLVDYAYLDDELYEFLQHPVYRALLATELEKTLNTTEQAFRAWCHSVGKSDKTISNYIQAIKGSLSEWSSRLADYPIELMNIGSTAELNTVRESLLEYEVFKQRNNTGKGMYSAALNLFQRFLQEESQSEIDADIQALQDIELDSTVRESLVSARKGQGLFRSRVLAQWNNRCAVTGYSDIRFLHASHIKPWRASDDRERLDRFNGFPLIPSIDMAFDIGYVSFSSSGNILISGELELPEKLGIYSNQQIQLAKHHQVYLEFHREVLFKG